MSGCFDLINTTAVFDDLRYGKVQYIKALRTAHYAVRPPQVRVLLQLWTDSTRWSAEAVCARPW
jgi:hypothetical protein